MGKEIVAKVVDVPKSCDKYNNIKVLWKEKIYEVNIARASCRNGDYKKGQEVILLKHQNYNDLVWPESRPEWTIVLIITVLFFVYLMNRKHFKKV